MKEHPAQLRTRRNYYEGISSEKAAREAEAGREVRVNQVFLRAQITKLDTFQDFEESASLRFVAAEHIWNRFLN